LFERTVGRDRKDERDGGEKADCQHCVQISEKFCHDDPLMAVVGAL
jgi:hypothetical protein